MTREKKTRKAPSGVKLDSSKPKKTRAELDQMSRDQKRLKKRKGLSSGSRQNPEGSSRKVENRTDKDPRIGSKKPVPLMVEFVNRQPKKAAVVKPVEKETLTPELELAQLEADERLHLLLDRIDSGESVSEEEQNYINSSLDRVDELMQLLGLSDEEEDESETPAPVKSSDPEDLWERFNNSDPKSF
ncbi:MAG: Der GTPase-activating protein YihI [Plesiomonas sp.]